MGPSVLGMVGADPGGGADTGRHKVTGNESEKMMFKVPSLRNIAETGPYFHDGKVPALNDAVGKMAEYELGTALTPEQVESIVVFLKSLTGEIPTDYIQKPELPPSSPATPKPDLSD